MMNREITFLQLREFLNHQFDVYNSIHFIPDDPVAIPHLFSTKEDIEIAGFLTATISWGNRTTILKNARWLMHLMEQTPHDFILNATSKELASVRRFVHRTFQGEDVDFMIRALQHIYQNKGGLQNLFSGMNRYGAMHAIINFRGAAFQVPHPHRSEKHIPDPRSGSAAKRLNMFLRWMIRSDDRGVDFGLWKTIDPANLICPLDTHVGKTARKLGLLTRKTNDWKAAEELTINLKQFDPNDPVKYDFALFGTGIHEPSLKSNLL